MYNSVGEYVKLKKMYSSISYYILMRLIHFNEQM